MLMEALWSLYFRAVFLNDDIPFRSGHKHKELGERTSRMAQYIIKGLFVEYVFRAVKSSGGTHGVFVLGRQIEVLCHDWFIVEGLTSVTNTQKAQKTRIRSERHKQNKTEAEIPKGAPIWTLSREALEHLNWVNRDIPIYDPDEEDNDNNEEEDNDNNEEVGTSSRKRKRKGKGKEKEKKNKKSKKNKKK
ncbi:hypothetical protein Glove_355g101 [Diversispora epigaea]|uniref:Uncharacterized protein n=1 Tax=Diversispora epigaea TaxID=1348612 RepID=A0A397HB62_9GLOM|nr:hypothetical protein Glove_355g101 [Diversispora epigaea]